MTDKNVQQIVEQISDNERLEEIYLNGKHEYILTTVDRKKVHHKYKVNFDKEFNATLERI